MNLHAAGLQGCFGLMFAVLAQIVAVRLGSENLQAIFYQLGRFREHLLTTTLLFLLSVALFNACGLAISKWGSCLLRSVVITMRAALIWVLDAMFAPHSLTWLETASVGLVSVGTLIFCYQTDKRYYWNKPLVCCRFLREPDESHDVLQIL